MATANAALIISLITALLAILALRNRPSRVVSAKIEELKQEIEVLQDRVKKCEDGRALLQDENFRLRMRIERLEGRADSSEEREKQEKHKHGHGL